MKRFIRVLFNPSVLLTDSLERYDWTWSLVVPGISFKGKEQDGLPGIPLYLISLQRN
jgi:hypothetical protein